MKKKVSPSQEFPLFVVFSLLQHCAAVIKTDNDYLKLAELVAFMTGISTEELDSLLSRELLSACQESIDQQHPDFAKEANKVVCGGCSQWVEPQRDKQLKISPLDPTVVAEIKKNSANTERPEIIGIMFTPFGIIVASTEEM